MRSFVNIHHPVLLSALLLLKTAMTSFAKLAWDSNVEADSVGHKIYKTTNYFILLLPEPLYLSPVFVPLDSLEDPDNPVFELQGLENGAIYFFAVTAENVLGEESAFSNTVSYTPTAAKAFQYSTAACQELPMEFGEIWVDHNWKPVTFVGTYLNPVVVAGPPSSKDPSDTVVRIDRISPEGFEISVEDWDCQDGIHAPERADYLAIEAGRKKN